VDILAQEHPGYASTPEACLRRRSITRPGYSMSPAHPTCSTRTSVDILVDELMICSGYPTWTVLLPVRQELPLGMVQSPS
jgi:hypothetical protein